MIKGFPISRWLPYIIGCGVLAAAVMAASGMGQTKVGVRLDDTDVPCAFFTPDSKYIVAGARKISLIDVKSHRLLDRFPEDARNAGGGVPTCPLIALSPDARRSHPPRVWWRCRSGSGNFKPAALCGRSTSIAHRLPPWHFLRTENGLPPARPYVSSTGRILEAVGEIWLRTSPRITTSRSGFPGTKLRSQM